MYLVLNIDTGYRNYETPSFHRSLVFLFCWHFRIFSKFLSISV